jgi:hypothetical protein
MFGGTCSDSPVFAKHFFHFSFSLFIPFTTVTKDKNVQTLIFYRKKTQDNLAACENPKIYHKSFTTRPAERNIERRRGTFPPFWHCIRLPIETMSIVHIYICNFWYTTPTFNHILPIYVLKNKGTFCVSKPFFLT